MTAKKTAPAKPVKPVKAVAKAKDDDKHAKKALPVKAAAAKPAAKDDPKGKRGPKPKDAKDGKKGALPKAGDEDFEALTAEIEGEVEGEGGDDGEAKAAKVKPLRMKVSRAKERALMREFGLDETQLTEEEVAKRRRRSWSTRKSSRPSCRC
jgi:RNA polymerase primary sigma factor